MTVNELKRLKELEYENARLKKMYANLSLVHEALKDAVEKKLERLLGKAARLTTLPQNIRLDIVRHVRLHTSAPGLSATIRERRVWVSP